MSVFDNENMVMPVSPMNNNSMGGDWWLILLIVFALFGGNFGGMNFGMMDGMMGGAMYPWFNQAQLTTNGFQNQGINAAIAGLQNSVTSGFGDVQLGLAGINQNICQTGGNLMSAISNGFAQAEIANNARQITDMQQNFANQTATMQGFNGVQSQLAQCCCDNRAGLADLKYTVATEACADRNAVSNALRDVLAANNASTQKILDQLCQDKIDAKNDTIAQLRSELMYARGQASQDVQTAQILAGQANEIDGVYNRLKNCPVGTYNVSNPYIYPSQNCGCGNF